MALSKIQTGLVDSQTNLTLTTPTISTGLYIGGSGSANLLDDYEEGTWSPVATPSGGAFNGVTVSGKYIKIGNLVNLQYMIQTNDIGTASGILYVNGVPFGAADYSWPAGNRNSVGIFREDYNTGVTGQSYLGGTTIVHKTRDDGNIAWQNNRVYICNLWYSVS